MKKVTKSLNELKNKKINIVKKESLIEIKGGDIYLHYHRGSNNRISD